MRPTGGPHFSSWIQTWASKIDNFGQYRVKRDLKKGCVADLKTVGSYQTQENLGRTDRALKHSMIAAKLGHDKSMKDLKMGYAMGLVRKEDFAAALRGHQAAVDATKSPQRDAAEEAKKNGELALDQALQSRQDSWCQFASVPAYNPN